MCKDFDSANYSVFFNKVVGYILSKYLIGEKSAEPI